MFPIAEVTRISHTQVKMFMECSLSWWLRYVLKIKPPQSVYPIIGSSVHEALSEYYMDKISGLPMQPTDAFIAYVRDKVRYDLGQVTYTPPKMGKTVDEIIDSRIAGLTEYISDLGNRLEPIATEKELIKKIPGTEVSFIGYIDIITKDTIVDFKLVGKPWGPKKVSDDLQPLAYFFLNGFNKSRFEFHFISADAPSKVMPRVITEEEVSEYIELLKRISLSMQEVALGRTPPIMCKNKCGSNCDYQEACMFYKYGMIDELMELAKKEESVADGDLASETVE